MTDDELLIDFTQTQLPWYVAHTKAKQEQLALDNLQRQNYSVYLPRYKRLKRVRDQQEIQWEPMFPRYIFVQPSSPEHSLAPIRSTLGVTNLVRFGSIPAIVPMDVMERIRAFESERNNLSGQQISPFKEGVQVRVATGPFAGLEGLISDVSNQRVVVLMQLLTKETRVSVSPHQLEVV
jgi:transcriptional antiterminator RfaH